MILTDVAMSLQSFLWLSVPPQWPAVLGGQLPLQHLCAVSPCYQHPVIILLSKMSQSLLQRKEATAHQNLRRMTGVRDPIKDYPSKEAV